MTDPWAAPTAAPKSAPAAWYGPPTAAPRGRRHRAVWVVGAGITLTLLAGLVAALTADRTPKDSASLAFDRWVAAAESGQAAKIRATVAPSQRALVSDQDPTGTGLPSVHFGYGITPHLGFQSSALSPDEAVARLARGGTYICRPDGRCQQVSGSGPSGMVLAVREDGHWWIVARPLQRPNPAYWR